jgi:Eukaryotic aspartyl protease
LRVQRLGSSPIFRAMARLRSSRCAMLLLLSCSRQGSVSGDADAAAHFASIPLQELGGVYVAGITIGGTEEFQVMIDTGSTTLGVASSKCTSCGVTNAYAPGRTAVDEHATATAVYGSTVTAHGWSGEIYEDAVSMGGVTPTVPVRFVAIDSANDFYFAQGRFQGIVGLAPKGRALPGTNGFLDQLVVATHLPNVLATEMCPTSGMLWLGGYDPSFTTAKPQYTPMPPSSPLLLNAYPVHLSSITVAGVSIPVASPEEPDSIVDTGTPNFILVSAAFDALAAQIEANHAFQRIFGGPGGDAGMADAGAIGGSWLSNTTACTAVDETKAELDAALPPLTLVFGTGPSSISVQTLATESYIREVVLSAGGTCFSPAISGTAPDLLNKAAVLGTAVLASSIVIVDRENQRVGFAPHTACP